MNILEIKKLSKSYRHQAVLKDLYLSVPVGSVFFLIGLNGVGKTTLLKCVLGLVEIDSGEISYAGTKMGFLIETPTFYGNLSAWENLRHYAMLIGCDESAIRETLELVKLDYKNRKPVKKYSLGMLQRLGIARSLLGDNELILLDEPFNGLDPVGIHEIKSLVTELATKHGKSIILSSHLIKETENLATHYAILHDGNIANTFTSSDLKNVRQCIKIPNAAFPDSENFNAFFEPWKKRVAYTLRGKDFIAYNTRIEDNALVNFQLALSRAGFVSDGNIQAFLSEGTLDEYFIALSRGTLENVVYR